VRRFSYTYSVQDFEPCAIVQWKYEVKGSNLQLSFSNRGLQRICCQRARLATRAGDDAECLARLLNEIACAETLVILASLPHVDTDVLGTKVVISCDTVRVLLALDGVAPIKGRPVTSTTVPAAKAARVVAVRIGADDINPEGAKWPR
jgi:hypothetical protein